MEALKRTRATKVQRRYTKPAGKYAFEKMILAASEIVLRNRGSGRQYRNGEVESILCKFPHWCIFSEEFPKGTIVGKEPLYDIRKINAVKLLDWLYSAGHSTYDSKMLVTQSRQFEVLNNQIEKLFK